MSAILNTDHESADYGWDWTGRGSSHVNSSKNGSLPPEQGAFLGHGVNRSVFETTCIGQSVTWKKDFAGLESPHATKRK
jgi:hypothetical protein